MQRVPRTATQMFVGGDIEPVATVRPGERFLVETADSLCGLVKTKSDIFHHIDEVFGRLGGGACPLTGPIYLEGAHPGQCVSLTIESITPAPRTGTGWTAVIPGWGALVHDQGYTLQPPVLPSTTICEVSKDEVVLPLENRTVRLPLRPFAGTVAIAPAGERRRTLSQSHEFLGDVDIPQLGPGTTLILKVQAEGGLLSIGDVHAAQGDGEITGVAVEVEADVTATMRALGIDEAKFIRLPVIETTEWVGCIAAFQGVQLADCIRAGYVDLVRRLVRYHGFSETDAYHLLGQVGKVQVGNMIDPFYSALVAINREFL